MQEALATDSGSCWAGGCFFLLPRPKRCLSDCQTMQLVALEDMSVARQRTRKLGEVFAFLHGLASTPFNTEVRGHLCNLP
eukprot:6422726-Amphidinium_carterae.3